MSQERTQFEEMNQRVRSSMFGDLWQFAMQNKKWWLLPIVVVMGLVSMLVVLAGSGAAPFIYTFF